jgi:N6-L-threonylcarbamoyladenine synthase
MIHAKYGGVVPELASRMHAEIIHSLIQKALDQAKVTIKEVTAIAVTYGPGLEGALLVGMTAAKTLAVVLNVPLISVNHMQGHLYAYWMDHQPVFPYLGLIVSGGHTQLVTVNDHFDFTLLGETRDDAVGEAFDKVARHLGLRYPGGPEIEKRAVKSNETNRL